MDNWLPLIRKDRELTVNSTAFETNPGLLYVVIALEMSVNCCILLFYPVFCYAVLKSGVVHRNFRLQLCAAASTYSSGIIGRFFLCYFQVTGPSDREIAHIFIPAQLARASSTCFAVSIICAFAIERSIATVYWSWYEEGSSSTLVVFATTESFNLLTYLTTSYMKYKIPNDGWFIHLLSVGAIGVIGFLVLYRWNVAMFNRAKAGAQIGEYSVSRSFQIKENVQVLQFMGTLLKCWLLFSALTFSTYGFFAFGPQGCNTIRAFSYTLFELLSALYCASFFYLSIVGNEHIHRQFRKLINRFVLKSSRVLDCEMSSVSRPDCLPDSERYFMQLREAWN